ncbi:unnamed protein product [Coregonus sp. 'balchen']|nr:unnamed protein product [Coregonus sp. 'balchen']
MMQCFHFIVEPVKNITAKLKESRKRAKNEKREPLEANQLFIVELARDLNRVCQRSEVLENIWKLEDIWPTPLCRAFILEWASLLESKKRPMQSDGWPEKREWREQDLFSEQDMENAKRTIINWTNDLRAQPEQSVWPGEAVAQVLEDLQAAWRSRHMPNLLTAMELIMWVLLTQGLDKEAIPQQWLIWKQRTQKIGAARYIPHSVWDWISNAAVEISLDLDTANPDLLISNDEKKMRCGFERKDVPNYHQRFDGWWCATGGGGLQLWPPLLGGGGGGAGLSAGRGQGVSPEEGLQVPEHRHGLPDPAPGEGHGTQGPDCALHCPAARPHPPQGGRLPGL